MSQPIFKINKIIPSIIDLSSIASLENKPLEKTRENNITRLTPIDVVFTNNQSQSSLKFSSNFERYQETKQQNKSLSQKNKLFLKTILNSKFLYFGLALIPILLFQADTHVSTGNITRKMPTSKFSI